MRVSLVYAKSQSLRERAAAAFSDPSAVKGEMARDEIYPPLGIAVLGAILERLGHEVRLYDDSIDAFDELCAGFRWAELVGISALTPNARRARELGQLARREYGRTVVMGGPHPTTNPEFFLESGAADVCVLGEGDQTLPELVEALREPERWPQIQGLAFLRDGVVCSTPRRPLVRALDELPFPAYHLFDIPKYMRLMITPGVTAITSRGCPYACTFCDAEMTPRQYRAMSPQRTVDLMEFILRAYDPPQIVLFDDLFTISRKRVLAICQEIVRRELHFEWVCESRLDTMDFELLRWMRKAGCAKIYYGLESGSPDVLVTMKKGLTPEKILRGARLNREVGMYFKYFILLGFPSETPKDHLLTEEIVRKSLPNAICVSVLQPIPGTEVYRELEPLLIQDVAEVDFHYWYSTETFRHPHFTHAQLHAQRERLILQHSRQAYSIPWRLRRKFERILAMARHPVLILDWLEGLRRKRSHRRRVAASAWSHTLSRVGRDVVALQVPQAPR